jgi:hypothetical protein
MQSTTSLFLPKNAEFARYIIQHKEKAQKAHNKVSAPVVKTQARLSFPFDYNSLVRNPSLNIRFKRNGVKIVKDLIKLKRRYSRSQINIKEVKDGASSCRK